MKASEAFAVGKHNIGFVSGMFLDLFGDNDVSTGVVLPNMYTLPQAMKDADILKQPNVSECTLGDVLATLDALTDVMKDGNWNLFYIKGTSRVGGVFWYGGGWHVCGWHRDDLAWDAGHRVFSPATDSMTLNPIPTDSLTLESLLARVEKLEATAWRSGLQNR